MKKNKKLNNKGFTLIEVLAVIVILVIIVSIAIPNISASLDRQTCKTTGNKAKLIESAAQFYVSDNRNNLIKNMKSADTCYIETSSLENGYITADDLKDGNDNDIEGYIVYNKSDETYTFYFNDDGCDLNPKDDEGNPIICNNKPNECDVTPAS